MPSVPAPSAAAPSAASTPPLPTSPVTPPTATTTAAPTAKAPLVAIADHKAPSAKAGGDTVVAPRPEAEAPPTAEAALVAGPKAGSAPALALPAPTASDKPTDKDVAREAWRRNLPDISGEEGRASVLIPIKGSIEGATYHINTKPKSVIVNLPKADSLITMHFYKIKREGFGNLWINHEGDGTTVKLMLGDAIAPQVEIHDEYVRINVRKPADPSTTAPTE